MLWRYCQRKNDLSFLWNNFCYLFLQPSAQLSPARGLPTMWSEPSTTPSLQWTPSEHKEFYFVQFLEQSVPTLFLDVTQKDTFWMSLLSDTPISVLGTLLLVFIRWIRCILIMETSKICSVGENPGTWIRNTLECNCIVNIQGSICAKKWVNCFVLCTCSVK